LNLVCMALDAAAGMNYLSSQNVVHRDLSARNLLMNKLWEPLSSNSKLMNFVVKISDFGLARRVQQYYRIRQSKQPVKWTAPEVFITLEFTSKSDVFSFGVLLNELFQLCKTEPYPSIDSAGVVSMYKEHPDADPTIMLAPEDAPLLIKKLQKACLMAHPEDRPTFETIWKELKKIKKELEANHELNQWEYPNQAPGTSVWDKAIQKIKKKNPYDDMPTKDESAYRDL